MGRRKRSEQMHLDDAEPGPAAIEVSTVPDSLDARAHQHDHVLSIDGAKYSNSGSGVQSGRRIDPSFLTIDGTIA